MITPYVAKVPPDLRANINQQISLECAELRDVFAGKILVTNNERERGSGRQFVNIVELLEGTKPMNY